MKKQQKYKMINDKLKKILEEKISRMLRQKSYYKMEMENGMCNRN